MCPIPDVESKTRHGPFQRVHARMKTPPTLDGWIQRRRSKENDVEEKIIINNKITIIIKIIIIIII